MVVFTKCVVCHKPAKYYCVKCRFTLCEDCRCPRHPDAEKIRLILIELRNKISEWLRNPEVARIPPSRKLVGKGYGEPKLQELCVWIKAKGFSKEDIVEVFDRWGEKCYEEQISGGGLRTDAGGEVRFKKKKKELLDCFSH